MDALTEELGSANGAREASGVGYGLLVRGEYGGIGQSVTGSYQHVTINRGPGKKALWLDFTRFDPQTGAPTVPHGLNIGDLVEVEVEAVGKRTKGGSPFATLLAVSCLVPV